jgi:hypothetical protein
MADDNSLVVHLSNCLPTGAIDIFNMRQNDIQTRPWTFTVNGTVDIPSYLVNGSIAPGGSAQNGSPIVDPRNVAIGADGQLLLDDGTVLMHIMEAALRIDPTTGTVQPLGTFRVLRRVLGAEITLTFTEYVINDYYILAQVIPPLLQISTGGNPGNLCDSYLNFQGRINQRICA